MLQGDLGAHLVFRVRLKVGLSARNLEDRLSLDGFRPPMKMLWRSYLSRQALGAPVSLSRQEVCESFRAKLIEALPKDSSMPKTCSE